MPNRQSPIANMHQQGDNLHTQLLRALAAPRPVGVAVPAARGAVQSRLTAVRRVRNGTHGGAGAPGRDRNHQRSVQRSFLVGPLISTLVQEHYGFAPLFLATAGIYSLAVIAYYIFFVRVNSAAAAASSTSPANIK